MPVQRAASYLQPCGTASCHSCTSLDVEVAGLAPTLVTTSLPLTSTQTWADANLSLAYSATIEAYVMRYNRAIIAALPDTLAGPPFYSVRQTRWQPSTLRNSTAVVVVAAQCTGCPPGFFTDSTFRNPICTEVGEVTQPLHTSLGLFELNLILALSPLGPRALPRWGDWLHPCHCHL